MLVRFRKAECILTILFVMLTLITVVPTNAKAATVVSQIVKTSEGKGYLQVDGQPYLNMHIQNLGSCVIPENGMTFAYLENFFEKTAYLNVKTASIMLRWSDIEPTSKGVYNWTYIDKYVDWCNKYGLHLDLAWMGSNVCGHAYIPGYDGYTSPTVPQYTWDINKYWGRDTSSLAPWIPNNTGHDTDANWLFQCERDAVTALFNHLATYDTNHRVIMFQVFNEPNFHPDWGSNNSVWLSLINQLAGAVKSSNYVVATRVNLCGTTNNKAINDLANVDCVGLDPYTTSVADIKSYMLDGKSDYEYIAENAGNYSNSTSLAITALVNGGFYDIWQLCDNGGVNDWGQGVFDSSYGSFKTWTLGNFKPLLHSGTDIKNLYAALNKIPTVIAQASKYSMAGFNIDTDNPSSSYSQWKSVNGKNISYYCTDGSVGMAVYDGNYYYCVSDTGNSSSNNWFTVQEHPASVSQGYINGNGNWVNQGNVSVSNNGNGTYGIPYNSQQVLRIQLSATTGLSGYYKLINKNSGKPVGVQSASTADGAAVIQWTDNGNADQQWLVVADGDGFYKFVNKNSGKLMVVQNGSTADGAAIIQWTDNGNADQHWSIVDVGGGYYKLVNKNSRELLNVSGNSTADGASIIQWPDYGTANEQWSLVRVN